MTPLILHPQGTPTCPRATPRQLYIAWVPFQRRAVAMEADFGYDLHHISVSFRSRVLRPLEYLLKAWQTLALLLRDRPPSSLDSDAARAAALFGLCLSSVVSARFKNHRRLPQRDLSPTLD
ncbi:MAG: hypothetical protein HC857_09695 [Synechococcales cyanobacterium RU_4_20]|nr:hypothetical protein [Synechococcales cyanobacterium RU_4_20]